MYYIIPRNNRELQQILLDIGDEYNYIIPRNNRELQHTRQAQVKRLYYIIPRNNRELQQDCGSLYDTTIISYQEITGNYSGVVRSERTIGLYHTKK